MAEKAGAMTTPTTITIPDPQEMERKVAPFTYSAMKCETAEEYQDLAQKRADARKVLKEIDALYSPIQKAASGLLEQIRSSRKRYEWPVNTGIALIDSALARFEREQTTKRAREEALLAEKLEAEAKAARESEVRRMERTGYVVEAERLSEEPVPTPIVPVLPVSIPKVEGLSSRTDWSCEVTDLKALVEAVAAGKAPIECLEANQTFCNSLARASKSALNIPGLKAVSKNIRTQKRS